MKNYYTSYLSKNHSGSLFYNACSNGNLKYVKESFEAVENLDFKVAGLNIACIRGNLDIVKYLLESGVDPNFITKFNNPLNELPIEDCISLKRNNIIKLLIKYGAKILPPIFPEIVNYKNDNSFILTVFEAAIEYGLLKEFEYLMDRGLSIHHKFPDGESVMTKAIKSGQIKIIEKLIVKYGYDINLDKDFTYNAIYQIHDLEVVNEIIALVKLVENLPNYFEYLLKCNEFAKAQDLINSGKININFQDNFGNSFAHKLYREENAEQIINFLIKNEINLLFEDQAGLTVLHNAVTFNDNKYVKSLLKYLNPKQINYQKELASALHIACRKPSLEVIEDLLKAKANPNLPSSYEYFPIYYFLEPVNKNGIKLLMEYGAKILPINLTSHSLKDKILPIFFEAVVEYGLLEEFHYLINNGMSIHHKFTDGESVIIKAIRSKQSNIVNVLIGYGYPLNSPVNSSENLLHEAVKIGDVDIVESLLDAGVKINTFNKDNETPLHVAIKNKQYDIAELLLNRGANVNISKSSRPSALKAAMQINDTKMFELLLNNAQHIIDIDKKEFEDFQDTYNETTLLHLASVKNDVNFARLLLKAGANPNLILSYNKGTTTSLIYTIKKFGDEAFELTQLLIKYGADVNLETDNETALTVASKNRSIKIIKTLLESKIDFAEKSLNHVALNFATEFDFPKFIKSLIDVGANPNFNYKNSNALRLAAKSEDYKNIIPIFLNHFLSNDDQGNIVQLFDYLSNIRNFSEKAFDIDISDLKIEACKHFLNFIQENDFKIFTFNLEKKLIDYIQPGLRDILKKLASIENKDIMLRILTDESHPIILSLNHVIDRFNQLEKDKHIYTEMGYDNKNCKIKGEYDSPLNQIYMDEELVSYIAQIQGNLEQDEDLYKKRKIKSVTYEPLDKEEIEQINILHRELDKAIEGRDIYQIISLLNQKCESVIDQTDIKIDNVLTRNINWVKEITKSREIPCNLSIY